MLYIWLRLIILLIALASLGYFSNELYNHVDKYIDIYKYLKCINK